MTRRIDALKLFFFFRTGYMTYLAMAIGAINVLTTTYFLIVDNVPILADLFTTFEIYILILVFGGVPIITGIGWIHMKRIGTYAAESNILVEEYPYNYKLAPGYNIEVFGPAYAAIINLHLKKLRGEKLTDDEVQSIQKIEKDLINLIEGGHAGTPPKGAY